MSTQTMDPATSRYLTSITQIPRLDRDAESELVRRFREQGDRRAAERLLNAHLRDVGFVALKYRHYGLPVADLVAEGNLGLMRALDKFDPSRGTRFGTYAAYWIRAYVVAYVLRSWNLIGGASGLLGTKMFFKLRRERARVAAQFGDGDAAAEALAERLGVSEGELSEMLGRLDVRETSLDAPAREDGTGTLVDALPADDDQEAALSRREALFHVSSFLQDIIAGLDEREQFILKRRLLADVEDEMSLADVGRTFGVSRERARQLEERTKKKLRCGLTAACHDEGRVDEIRDAII